MVLGSAVRPGSFSRPEEVVESHGCELADSPPVFFGELCGSGHANDFEEDGGVDEPYSVGNMICLGKGMQEVTD